MGKPPGLSEEYRSPNIDHDRDQSEHGASPKIAKWLFIVIAIVCFVLAVLVMVALHVPSGESAPG